MAGDGSHWENRACLVSLSFSLLSRGISLSLGLRFRFGFGLVVAVALCRSLAGALLGVIIYIPTGALELDGGRGDHLLHLVLSAFRALGNDRIRELLDLLKTV